ncbi:aspartate aminotransferase family protein [Treponema sp.]|uniref:pyridoxal phosphate-dependent decarboxylase family protein n=1 Tax=Treponema sp. TaxID=166 RepID=UPI00298DB99B|nr:aspartate aminotransferase family protein [Treponema sp.]
MNTNKVFITDASGALEEYSDIIAKTSRAITEAYKNDKAYTGPEPFDLKKAIQSVMLPQSGIGFDKTLEEVKKVILPNFVRTSSTDYMAHLHSATLLETIAAELIISTFNQSMDSWDQSPVATEIEVDVIRQLCDLYGYDKNADGVFTSGGSQSNTTGIFLARDWFCKTKFNYDVKKYGLPDNYRKFRLYASEISHFSMEKSTHMLGLGYDAVVKVPVDSRQKMDIAALKDLIARDKAAGNIPFCIVATVGTTDYGSIDPINEIADICKAEGIWFHCDAAYGSGAIMSDKYRARIAGLNKADSITVDFHKMFMMPISCSCSLIKDARNFEPFELHADYLNREEDEEDGYTNLVSKSMQTTRRFDALKVWMSFKCRGKDGWNELIDTCIENAAYVYESLGKRAGFERTCQPELSSIVFRLYDKAISEEENDEVNKKVRRSLIHEKGVVIGQTVYNGRVHLKFTLINPLTTHQKLDELLDLIYSLKE